MKYKLSDIMYIIGGGTPKTSISRYWGGNIPWLSVKDFNNDSRYVYSTEKSITEEGLSHSSTKLLQQKDTIISARGTVGEIAMIPYPMAFNQSCYGLRAKKEIIDSVFLYYLIKHNLNILKKRTHGTVFDTITKDTFSYIEVEIPNKEIQIKITNILEQIDDKIELNHKINENLEEQAQAVFKNWFIDFEFPNEEGQPYKSSGGKMIWNEELQKEIPEAWKNGTIEDLSEEIICGKTPSTKKQEYYGSDIPFITIPDMHDKIYIVKTERYLSKFGANSQFTKYLPKNSICVSCIGTAGLVSLVYEKSQTNQQINSIIPKEDFSAYYIFLLMKNISKVIINLGQSGTTMCNLNKLQFSKINIMIPSIKIMNLFDKVVYSLFEQILNNTLENEKLADLRDTLLPRLMSGEIDVSALKYKI